MDSENVNTNTWIDIIYSFIKDLTIIKQYIAFLSSYRYHKNI